MNFSNSPKNKVVISTGEIKDIPYKWIKELENELKIWRRETADMNQCLPYHIFPDKTLDRLLEGLPRVKNDLWLIKGFNEHSINTYGASICEIINSFLVKKDVVDILYGTSAFDIKSDRIRAILDYLGILNYFDKSDIEINHSDKLNLYKDKETTIKEPFPRKGKRWDIIEEKKLISEFQQGISIATISEIHQRKPGGISSRLEKLGLIDPDQKYDKKVDKNVNSNTKQYEPQILTCFDCRHCNAVVTNGDCPGEDKICEKFDKLYIEPKYQEKHRPEYGDATNIRLKKSKYNN